MGTRAARPALSRGSASWRVRPPPMPLSPIASRNSAAWTRYSTPRGLSGRRFGDGPVHETSEEGWEFTLDHNVGVMFRMCRAVIGPHAAAAGRRDGGVRGAIVNMGSVLADAPEPRHFATHAYAAAKGAVVAMSRSMAAFYAPHRIRVNVLAPGLVRTPASERAGNPELLDFIKKKQPLSGGMVDAEDVARAALFLLSEDARVHHRRGNRRRWRMERHRRLSTEEPHGRIRNRYRRRADPRRHGG